jgi:bifunctional lysine-specific demethylase and histidyl-hydroxylase NO66
VPDNPVALRRCVGDVDRFIGERWARRVHHHRGEDFSDLLSLEHVDHIVATMALRTPAFRLVKQGRTLERASYTRTARVGSRSIDDLIDVGRVYRHFDDGATIVLQGLHRYWEPVTRFCRDLELALTHPVQANAYVTPPVSSGLKVHHDPHDVFALQTYGRKQWVTYEAAGTGGGPAPALDVELIPGDSLYVPKGTPHAARTVDVASVHLTIGIRTVVWRDVARRLLDRALDGPDLDEPLPVGFAHDPEALARLAAARLPALTQAVAQADPAAAAAAEARRFWSGRAPVLTGHLGQLLELDRIDDGALLARRPGSVCQLVAGNGRLTVLLGDRELRMPSALEPAMRVVAGRDSFRVSELAPYLDPRSRMVLVRRLVREGLLTVAGG